MERYEDFWQLTETALRLAVRRLSINATESQLERLMEAYLNPAAFDEARSARRRSRDRRWPSSRTVRQGCWTRPSAASLESYFAEIISWTG